MNSTGRSRGIVVVGAVLVVGLGVSLALVLRPAGQPGQTSKSGTSSSVSSGPSNLPGPSGSGGVALGVYVKPDAAAGGLEPTIGQFESSIGRRLAIVQTFTGWETAAGAPIPFPTRFATYADSTGATPMITWQPEQAVDARQSPKGMLSDQPDFSLTQLSSGRYDTYIRSWADQAKAFAHLVYVRPMHEMNDRTYPWGFGVNGNTSPSQYVAAWQHIVGIFRTEGADNVQFVWCAGARPATPDPAEFFPGDSFVSWISLDGYNRGTPWQSFTSIFSLPYREITAVSARPVMIAETGSVENPADPGAKAAWITSALEDEIPNQFPRIRAVLYFDAPGRGFSYALNSSSDSLHAFRTAAASPELQGTARS